MNSAHIDRAVFVTGPFGKKVCVRAILGICEAVNIWQENHQAQNDSSFYLTPQEVSNGNNARKDHGNPKDHMGKAIRWAYRFGA